MVNRLIHIHIIFLPDRFFPSGRLLRRCLAALSLDPSNPLHALPSQRIRAPFYILANIGASHLLYLNFMIHYNISCYVKRDWQRSQHLDLGLGAPETEY